MLTAERGTLDAPLVAGSSWLGGGRRGSKASRGVRRFAEPLQRGKRRSTTAWPTPPPVPIMRRTAAVGANRNATTGLVSSMLSFDESEDLLWAKELVATSSATAQAHCDLQLDPPAPPDEDGDRPFAGLHCACLTAPGPTRTRPEHIADLLNVSRRRSMLPWQLFSAGSPLVRSLQPPGSRERALLATQERQAATRQDELCSACAKQLVNRNQVSAPRRCKCTSGASAGRLRGSVSLPGHH